MPRDRRSERVLAIVARFPWKEYNRENPVRLDELHKEFPDEPVGLLVEAQSLINNHRPADPFDGL